MLGLAEVDVVGHSFGGGVAQMCSVLWALQKKDSDIAMTMPVDLGEVWSVSSNTRLR